MAPPTATPPKLSSTAPTRPIAMAGPATGISALAAAAAPSSPPVAAPTAPPITPPTALPIPGCSASLVGSADTSLSERPGTRTRMLLGDRPAARGLATALSAAARSAKIPIVGLIIKSPSLLQAVRSARPRRRASLGARRLTLEPRCALQEFHDERQEACQAGADSRSNGSTRRSERTSRNRVILIEQKCSGFTERTRRQLTVGAVTITVLAARVAPRRARWLDPWASSVSATWDDPWPRNSSR